MPFSTKSVLQDMARHIHLATEFVAGIDFEAFENDERTIFAVIRCLEVISEASRRLPDELKERQPSIPWKDVAGAGNVYRHDYEDVAPKLLWDTVQLALPALRDVIEQEIQRAASSPDGCGPKD
jgi:uncharacterized protein with HEPN domain